MDGWLPTRQLFSNNKKRADCILEALVVPTHACLPALGVDDHEDDNHNNNNNQTHCVPIALQIFIFAF